MRTSPHLIIPRFCDKSFSLFFGSLNCTENGGKTTSYYCCSLFSLERLPLTTTTTFFIIVVIVTPIRRILTRRFPLLCARVNREYIKNRPYSAVASINKKAFVDAVAEAAGVEKKVAENVVNAALGVVTASVAAGEKITLTGFGTFERKMRSAREGRNPKTGDPLKIPAAAYPSFSAGKSFKDAVKK